MATLYWGGGSGTWDGFTTGNWYTDVGRTTLSDRAPSAEDDVVFDSASNATDYTVTISGNTTVCRDVTIAGPASGNLTLAGTNNWFVYGSLTLPATGLTRTYSGTLSFYGGGSNTITNNGFAPTSGEIQFQSNGGSWTLQDALTGVGTIRLRGGTLNTNNQTLSCQTINADSSAVFPCALILGSSTVNCSNTFIAQTTLFTLDAGTSSITLGSSSANTGNIAGGSLTFYNVTFSSAAIVTSNFYGNNTFNNLTFTTKSAAGVSNVVLNGNQTVTGTLTISGQSGANRYFFRSDTIGTPRTLTVGTVATLTDVDFRDIVVAGASAPWSGTRLGNCLGNTNITFGAGANKYIAASTGSSNWSADIWSSTSGGSASTADFPLAQDTVIIDDAGLNTSATLTLNIAYNIGGFDAGSRTNAASFTISGTSPFFYGDVTFSTAIGGVRNVQANYCGRTTQNITTNGRFQAGVNIDSPGGTVKLLDNFSGATNFFNLINGTLDFNNKDVGGLRITASGTASKTLMLGSGSITLNTGVGSSAVVSNLTIAPTTAPIICTTSSEIGFNGITATFGGEITISGAAGVCTVYGTTTIANLSISNAPTSTGVTNKLRLFGDLTVTGTLALANGTSVTQRAFVLSNTIGTQRTLSAATVSGLSDIDFRDINATGAADWTTGTRLGDCGGNTGITFPAAKSVYWNLAGTQNWSATAWATGSGGTPDVNNFPLAQDTAVFDDTGSVGTVTINAAWNIGTINAGSRTSAWTLSGSSGPTFYGDLIYGSGVTASALGTYSFSGRGTQTLTTAGKTLSIGLSIVKPSGTFQHGDAFTSTTTASVLIGAGNYTTQNYNITAGSLSGSGSNVRSITLGTSTLTLASTTPVLLSNTTNLTFSGASSTINLSTASAKTFAGGGLVYGTVSSTGGTTSVLAIEGSNKFGTLTNSARTYMRWTAGTTQEITNFTYSGASGNVVRWYTSIPGQRATIKQAETGGSLAAVGANSVDGGNNSGLSFTGTSPDYFYVKDIAYSGVGGTGNFFMFFK